MDLRITICNGEKDALLPPTDQKSLPDSAFNSTERCRFTVICWWLVLFNQKCLAMVFPRRSSGYCLDGERDIVLVTITFSSNFAISRLCALVCCLKNGDHTMSIYGCGSTNLSFILAFGNVFIPCSTSGDLSTLFSTSFWTRKTESEELNLIKSWIAFS
jgi:hypothetical protein